MGYNNYMAPTKLPTRVKQIPPAVRIATIIALLGGLYFLRNFVGVILFSALLSLVFNPIYKTVLRKTHVQAVALAATLVSMTVAAVLPLLIITGLGITQAASVVDDIKQSGVSVGNANVEELINTGTERANKTLAALPGGESLQIDRTKVNGWLKSGATQALQALLSVLKKVGLGFFGFVTTVIVAIFLIMAMLRYQRELLDFIRGLSPFHRDVMDVYIRRAIIMTKAMVKGQFVIAVAQGLASAASLWVVGVDYFWLLFVILTFLSFIPLGGGVVTIPIGIILLFTGNIWQGLFVIIFHLTVVSFIDNLLRPRLVAADAHLDTALMLLAVFAGIAAFGAAGVVYGPVLMILIVTTLEMYVAFNRSSHKVELPELTPKSK